MMRVGNLQNVVCLITLALQSLDVEGGCPTNCYCDTLRQIADCVHAGLTHIPLRLPDPVGLKQLILRGNQITHLISEIVAYPHLELLDFSDNSLSAVDDNVLDALPELKYLYFHNNRLTSVGKGTFKGLISLEELDLSHNQLNQLNDDVFGELTKLTILNLMGNEIRTVSDHSFSGLVSLRVLNLSDNRFTSVPVASLRESPSLTDLNLDFNHLQILHLYNVTKNLESLSSLSVEGNKVSRLTWNSEYRKDSDPPNLTKLSLKSNVLTTIPTESLRHLKNLVTLDMSGNLFRRFVADSVKGLDSLKYLYLNSLAKLEIIDDFAFSEINTLTSLEMHSSRKLHTINEKAFLGLPMLTHVDLHANNLRTLNPNTFDWLDLKVLDLRYNQWSCDCHLRWLKDVLLHHHAKNASFYVEEIFCNSPEELASYRVIEVKDNLYKCHKSQDAHEFEDRIMLGIFVSFTVLLTILLIILLYRLNYFKCFRNSMRQLPQVNYHASLNAVTNGHCRVISCENQNEEQLNIAANEVRPEDEAA